MNPTWGLINPLSALLLRKNTNLKIKKTWKQEEGKREVKMPYL
jgi:hypothetical protein